MRFDIICEANDIEHRLTEPNHPWTNGQVERMNRTIKEVTVKRYQYESHDQVRMHLADFMAAYNFARRHKTLSGLTPTNTPSKYGRETQTGPSSFRCGDKHLNRENEAAIDTLARSSWPYCVWL